MAASRAAAPPKAKVPAKKKPAAPKAKATPKPKAVTPEHDEAGNYIGQRRQA